MAQAFAKEKVCMILLTLSKSISSLGRPKVGHCTVWFCRLEKKEDFPSKLKTFLIKIIFKLKNLQFAKFSILLTYFDKPWTKHQPHFLDLRDKFRVLLHT